jgi:hypothetical protein
MQGVDCRLAVEHSYATDGFYRTCLDISDDAGRVSQVCRTVHLGQLHAVVTVAPGGARAGASGTADLPVVVSVTAGGAPVPGATVTIEGAASNEAATTDSSGRARFIVRRDRLRRASGGGVSAQPFSLGGLEVAVSADGWKQHRQELQLPDDEAIQHLQRTAARLRTEAIRDLANTLRPGPDLRQIAGRSPIAFEPGFRSDLLPGRC